MPQENQNHQKAKESTPAEVALYEQWERSNLLNLMFIKTKITTSIRGYVKQYEKSKIC